MSPSSWTASRSSTSSALLLSIRVPAEVVDVEALDDLVLAVLGGAREARDDPLGSAVAPVADHAHRHPVAVGRAEDPGADVVDGGVGGRGRRREAPRLDDGGAALLHGGDEVALEPGLVGAGRGEAGLAVDLGVEHVGVLRGRVVAPDRHLRDGGAVHAGLGRQLRDGAVVVEARHGREPARVEVLGVALRDQRVRVGGVADHEHLHVALGAARTGPRPAA